MKRRVCLILAIIGFCASGFLRAQETNIPSPAQIYATNRGFPEAVIRSLTALAKIDVISQRINDVPLANSGSGVLIGNGLMVLVTHYLPPFKEVVCGNKMIIYISFNDKIYKGQVLLYHDAFDLALVQFDPGTDFGIKPVSLAKEYPKLGDKLFLHGLPGPGTFAATLESFFVYAEPELNFSYAFKNSHYPFNVIKIYSEPGPENGLSGGMLLNKNGELVGILLGATPSLGRFTVSVSFEHIQAGLDLLKSGNNFCKEEPK